MSKWICAAFAAVLLISCGRRDAMPVYPYSLPSTGEKDVIDVNLIKANSGHMISARWPARDDALIKIHVADILAPFAGQPWSFEAMEHLDSLIDGKRARVRVLESFRGPEGVSVIGRVYVGKQDLSWVLVGNGDAWVWEGESNDLELKKLQTWARNHQKGLWSLPESEREPPWEFMKKKIKRKMTQSEESTQK